MVLNIRTISKYFIEFLIVAFGVYLGVYAGEIQSEKRTNEKKEKSLAFIIEELENNHAKLEASYQYHKSIQEEFYEITQTIDPSDYLTPYIGNTLFKHDKIKGWKGLGNSNLDDTAFETAKISGIIQEFDFETIQAISGIYQFQDEYTDISNSLLNKFISFNSSTTVLDMMSVIDQMGSDLKDYEYACKERISQVLELLKQSKQKSEADESGEQEKASSTPNS
jgi:hypothetical protein